MISKLLQVIIRNQYLKQDTYALFLVTYLGNTKKPINYEKVKSNRYAQCMQHIEVYVLFSYKL